MLKTDGPSAMKCASSVVPGGRVPFADNTPSALAVPVFFWCYEESGVSMLLYPPCLLSTLFYAVSSPLVT